MLSTLYRLLALALHITTTFAAPLASASNISSTNNSSIEHVVILDKSHTNATTILSLLDLHPTHPSVLYTWHNPAFQGFAAHLTPNHLAILTTAPNILHIEPTTPVQAQTTTVRTSSPWGLQRISSSTYLFGNPQSLNYTYTYSAPTLGLGADIYIIDTGINAASDIFSGRARTGWSFEPDAIDHDGHGTHVSGTAAGGIVGVASDANIIAVKALGDTGSGSSTTCIAGIDWVLNAHTARKGQTGFVGSVMSLSWGLSGVSGAIQTAVGAALDAGIHVSIAAGNAAGDACAASPSAAGGNNSAAVVVGSIDEAATVSSFSNTGKCVDLYAPGEDVLSAWIGGPNVLNYLSGTSMACPHVSGLMAYLMAGDAVLAASPSAMKAVILGLALEGVVQGAEGGGAGRLVNNGMVDSGTGTGEEAVLEG